MTDDSLEQIIHDLSFRAKDRAGIFKRLSPAQQGQAFVALSRRVQSAILAGLSRQEAVAVLEHLDLDEATDALSALPKREQKRIIGELTGQLQKDIGLLLQFEPETAGRLANFDYIQVDAEETVVQAAAQFRVHEKRTGRLPTMLVMRRGRVAGYLPGHQLGLAPRRDAVKKHLRPIGAVRSDAEHHDVLKTFRSHPHEKLVVTGTGGNVVGIMYADDVLRALHKQESKSLYDFAGVSKEEHVYDPALRKVRFRYKWLILNMATAFLAAATVKLFDATIAKYVLLAVYMPIVAGMGGNAATQTLAVMVRGMALGQVTAANAWRVLGREVAAGFANGLINAAIVAAVVIALSQDARIAAILAFAMVFNLMVAGFFGTIVPLVMKRLGKDPASSATIFITTATDVLGFLVFLGLATLLLP